MSEAGRMGGWEAEFKESETQRLLKKVNQSEGRWVLSEYCSQPGQRLAACESILLGEWKHLRQPTSIWLTLQKAAQPRGTCLNSAGLFFLLCFNRKNMFLCIPSSMVGNIFSVFTMPGAENISAFRTVWHFKACLRWSSPAQSSAEYTQPKKGPYKARSVQSREALRTPASGEISSLCIRLMNECSRLIYAARASKDSILFLRFSLLNWPAEGNKNDAWQVDGWR